MNATANNHWYNFYANRAKEYISQYGNNFCLIINGSNQYDDFYILPFKYFKDFFSPDYLDGNNRWIGTIKGHRIYLTCNGKIPKSTPVDQYYNAFDLLNMPDQ